MTVARSTRAEADVRRCGHRWTGPILVLTLVATGAASSCNRSASTTPRPHTGDEGEHDDEGSGRLVLATPSREETPDEARQYVASEEAFGSCLAPPRTALGPANCLTGKGHPPECRFATHGLWSDAPAWSGEEERQRLWYRQELDGTAVARWTRSPTDEWKDKYLTGNVVVYDSAGAVRLCVPQRELCDDAAFSEGGMPSNRRWVRPYEEARFIEDTLTIAGPHFMAALAPDGSIQWRRGLGRHAGSGRQILILNRDERRKRLLIEILDRGSGAEVAAASRPLPPGAVYPVVRSDGSFSILFEGSTAGTREARLTLSADREIHITPLEDAPAATLRLDPTSGLRKAPEAVVRFADLVVDGKLKRERVRAILRAHVNEVEACYNRGTERRPKLAGRVSVKFTIDERGTTNSAQLVSTTLDDAYVDFCILQAVGRWNYPAPTDGADVVVESSLVLRTR